MTIHTVVTVSMLFIINYKNNQRMGDNRPAVITFINYSLSIHKPYFKCFSANIFLNRKGVGQVYCLRFTKAEVV